jgi:hypothetical protein
MLYVVLDILEREPDYSPDLERAEVVSEKFCK